MVLSILPLDEIPLGKGGRSNKDGQESESKFPTYPKERVKPVSPERCTIHPPKVYDEDCGAIIGAIECWRICSVSWINS